MCAQGKAGRRQRARRRFARRLYPSHGPLWFITSHSRFALASAMRKKKRLKTRLYRPFLKENLACCHSRHLATPPLVSLRNDVRETSAEIPYWWRVTTQIWLVLLIGWNKYFPRSTTNQKHYPDLGSDASPAWNFYARFSDVPVVASPNVGCFLTLKLPLLLYAIILHSAPSLVLQPPPDNYCAVPKSRECKLNVAVVETGTGNYS